ncbi:glycoside hydrolase superfamily [Baffinella frigidus]|nr:glycoside hydrolase superfamily [Cryptophyta sp. CCMP2293]
MGSISTEVLLYGDFIAAFAERFAAFIPNVVVEAQIGLGPAGELRYPSYPLAHWHFPGIGQFQCYDRYMRRDLVRAAQALKRPELGLVWPPQNNEVGNYNYSGEHTQFFCDTGLWNTTDGEFFLKWYSDALIAHGDRVLSRAAKVLKGTGMVLAAKVAGIHWGGKTLAHGPELTAGSVHPTFR